MSRSEGRATADSVALIVIPIVAIGLVTGLLASSVDDPDDRVEIPVEDLVAPLSPD